MRDNFKAFEDKNCAILGISPDGVDSHKKFADELKLQFDLIADPDKKAHAAYGFNGPIRALFLIDREGKLRFVNRKYALKPEPWDELLKAVASLEK